MWEKLYELLKHLDRLTEKYPEENNFTIEVEQDVYDFGIKIGIITDDGFIHFKNKTFCLG